MIDTLKDGFVDGWKKEKFTSVQKIGILAVVLAAVLTSWFDDMGALKHIWIAAMASITVFELYRRKLLPRIAESLNLKSEFSANVCTIVATYLLSSISGAGLLTAFINVVGLSAAILLIHSSLPKLYYSSLFAFGSISLLIFAVTGVLHPVLSLVPAICLAGLAALGFRRTIIEESNEVECEAQLEYKAKRFRIYQNEMLKVIFALLVTFATGVAVVYWIMLSINPFWMRANRISKYETLHRLPHEVNLRVLEVSSLKELQFYKSQLTKFPVVIKPSICTTNSRNVMKCSDYQCLEKYLEIRLKQGPRGDGQNIDYGAWVIQEYTDDLEGVVFYYKFPYMKHGGIKNIGIRDPSIKTKPKSKDSSLIARYWPGTFRTDFSSEYVQFFDELASKIPGYNGGRFDVSLPSSDLDNPLGIHVFELNVFFLGCIAEKKAQTLSAELGRLRTSLMQFYIGVVNIVAGYNFLSFWGIAMKVPQLIERAVVCGNHEHIFAKP